MVEMENVEIKNCPVEVANDIWNEAIEQAAREAELWMDETVPTRIRKLKK